MTMPVAELQKFDPSYVLSLFVLDATPCGGGVSYLAPEPNILGGNIVWQGITYTVRAIEFSDGLEWSSKGVLPRPKVRVSALDGVVGALTRDLHDLVGAVVTLRRMCYRHIDAVNYPGGVNPTADPLAHWEDEPWVIERKSLENDSIIEFELRVPMDAENVMVPGERITANVCPWLYKGVECGYAGTLPTCSKSLDDCRRHHSGGTGSMTITANSGTNTYTRADGGSFITDGFAVGGGVSVRGFSVPSNNGVATVSVVSASSMTVTTANSTGAQTTKTLTSEIAYAASLFPVPGVALPYGSFPGTARVS